MKINFEDQGVGGAVANLAPRFAVYSETDQLTDVLLCAPDHLAPVPCCSVTKQSLRESFCFSAAAAQGEHLALRRELETHGVRCHMLDARADMPDLCFTRDSLVTTPWGVVRLNPALAHRSNEAKHAEALASGLSRRPIARIDEGMIEGGDIAIVRPGLLIVGVSDERTTEAGADAFSARFLADGWTVVKYRFDPHFLHLDTIFCMLDDQHALACVEVLDDAFIGSLTSNGIKCLPVSYKEARKLGCNILSIGSRTIIAGTGTPRVSAMMRQAGFVVVDVAISQFAACGGGIHCLTMPLRRLQSGHNAPERLGKTGHC